MNKVMNKMKNGIKKAKNYVTAKKMLVSAYLMSVLCDLTTTTAYATNNGTSTGTGTSTTAEDKWDTVIGFIVPWITRLGGVVILIGAVEFGLAFKNDDAEGKTKGMRTIIAGCIVTAVGFSSDLFLA